MADDSVSTQEFFIRKLATRNVTLYPARAHIIRDIDDIVLKPGLNEITIHGITPTADESSIKVDGKGAATITDMTVDLVHNNDVYEDVYPSDDDDDDEDSLSDWDTPDTDDLESPQSKCLEAEKREIENQIEEIKAEKVAANGKLNMLHFYTKSVAEDRPTDLRKCLEIYEHEGISAQMEVHGCCAREQELQKKLRKVDKKLAREVAVLQKQQQRELKDKLKTREKKQREKQAKLDARRRLKEERAQFWPKKTYRIVISLDAGFDTPATSRRNSIESITASVAKPSSASSSAGAATGQVSLSLSYITHSAFWSPRYELNLHTPTSSGSVIYRAEYVNMTSEVWKDARVCLSTSEAAFTGLSETIPSMLPWTIQLAKKGTVGSQRVGALTSGQEEAHKHSTVQQTNQAIQSREQLFGVANVNKPTHLPQAQQVQAPWMVQQAQQQRAPNVRAHMPQSHQQDAQMQRKLMRRQAGETSGGGLFGSANANMNSNVASSFAARAAPPPAPGRSLFGNSNPSSNVQAYEAEAEPPSPTGGDDETLLEDLPSLATEEATWAEDGLTFTYEIPGVRSIKPSFTKRRFRIALLSLKSVVLSHFLIPKLRPAAFLKARITNPSNTLTLLRGPVGITLDASFLGNTIIPRCSAGEVFSLSLGVDPGVTVSYARPIVKRSAGGGLFSSKDDSATYTRTVTITNTKPAPRLVTGCILDQVPLSQDEKLRSSIIRPGSLSNANLSTAGDSSSSTQSSHAIMATVPRPDGIGVTKDGKEMKGSAANNEWGKATVVLKAKGEVRWEFKLEAGKTVRFALEYETKCPSGETVVQV